jgi:hypothetical protein
MTANVTRRRPTRIDPAGEPIRGSAWMNLHFLKDGRSFHGGTTFETEKEAREAAEDNQKSERVDGDERLRRGIKFTVVVPWTSPQIEYFYRDYSHHIQVPVKP